MLQTPSMPVHGRCIIVPRLGRHLTPQRVRCVHECQTCNVHIKHVCSCQACNVHIGHVCSCRVCSMHVRHVCSCRVCNLHIEHALSFRACCMHIGLACSYTLAQFVAYPYNLWRNWATCGMPMAYLCAQGARQCESDTCPCMMNLWHTHARTCHAHIKTLESNFRLVYKCKDRLGDHKCSYGLDLKNIAIVMCIDGYKSCCMPTDEMFWS